MPTLESHLGYPVTWNTGPVQNTSLVLPGKYLYKDWVDARKALAEYRRQVRYKVLEPTPLPENPYWHKQWNMVWARQDVTYIPFGGKEPVYDYGNWGTMPPVNPSLPTAAHTEIYNRCLRKLPGKMNGTQFNLPLFLAELHKTSDMILHAKDVILRMLQGLPPTRNQRTINGRAYWKRSKEPVKTDPVRPLDIWLEYRYGWRLLLKDILDGLKALWDAQHAGLTCRTSVSDFAAYKGRTLWTAGTTNCFNSSLIQADLEETWTVRRDVKITFRWKDTLGPTVGTLQQFGITNPLNLVWELIPYSFVLDWFIPVGDYLSQLDMFIGKSFQSGSVSYIESRWRSFKPVNLRQLNTSFQPSVVAANMPASSLTERYYRRVPLTTFPSSAIPRFQPELNLKRVIDGIGLLSQRRRQL